MKIVNKPVSLTFWILQYLCTPQLRISPSSLWFVLHQHVNFHWLPAPPFRSMNRHRKTRYWCKITIIIICSKLSKILILKFDVLFYLFVSQSDIKVVIMVEFKEFSTKQLLKTIFGFTEIKLLHIQNIYFSISLERLTIPQKSIFHLLCDNFSLKSVSSFGFCFMILSSVNTYFPLLHYTLLLIKIKIYLRYTY